jgi:ATP-dependent DNA ligase
MTLNTFPIAPPIEPMLAKLAEDLPAGDGFLYEPKWDGFRAIVFRGTSDVFIQCTGRMSRASARCST